MKSCAKIKIAAAVLLFEILFRGSLMAAPEATNASARDFFNAGTKNLSAKKLADAEAMFRAALARQDETVQPLALYNLGQAQFAEGSEELKKNPSGPAKTRGGNAVESAGGAIQSAESALVANDLQVMIDAYLRGKGARKELRAATAAVQHAMEEQGRVLQNWRRASGDFQGAAELNPTGTNAAYNVSVVEKNIAVLVDQLRQMQATAANGAQQGLKLDGLLAQLKGKIPNGQLPGAAGDGDDKDPDGTSPEELAGTAEGASKDGSQMELTLSPEEAGNLLDGFRLGDRRLPMGQGDTGEPRNRKLRDW